MSTTDSEIERLWRDILDLIEEGRVVPVVGEELLEVTVAGHTVRLYDFLAARLAERLGLEETAEGASLNDVVGRFLEAGGDVYDVYPQLKRAMPPDAEVEVPEALRKLAAIEPFQLFVSTTFDSLLRRALDETRFGGAERTESLAFAPAEPEDLPQHWEGRGAPLVYSLLGRLSAVPEYAVSEEDVLEFMHALQSETRRPARLHQELTRNSLLMIGCSFSGWLARFFLRMAKSDRLSGGRGKLDVLADGAASGDRQLTLFLDRFSTRTRIFPDTPRAFVDELHRRWQERVEDASGGPGDPPGRQAPHEGAVFVSYASEDRDVATALRDALEAAGMKAWFDEDELRAGDNWAAEIREGLRTCSVVVPLISRHTRTVKPRYFRTEWVRAEEVREQLPKNRRFFVPLAIDDTSEDAPELPDAFKASQWFRSTDDTIPAEFVERVRDLYRAYQVSLEGEA